MFSRRVPCRRGDAHRMRRGISDCVRVTPVICGRRPEPVEAVATEASGQAEVSGADAVVQRPVGPRVTCQETAYEEVGSAQAHMQAPLERHQTLELVCSSQSPSQ